MKYEIRFSETDGRGLYATEDIRQGETIEELPRIAQNIPDMYSIEIHGVHLNCRTHAVGATNHSCDPNAAIKGNRLVAWRCVVAGEELTIDYKKTESSLAAPFNCLCGAKKCRGRIE